MELLRFPVILFFTFYLSLQHCKADQVREFRKPCNQPIDCGTNHVIAILNIVSNQGSIRGFRIDAKNKCNGQHKCYIPREDKNCFIEYYCVDDRFVQDCSAMNVSKRIGNSFDLFRCYKQNKSEKKINCWDFSEDVYHHWIVLRGVMRIKSGSDADRKAMKNFQLITSANKSEVCTSSKYMWIIYVGTKSQNAVINIYSKTDPALIDSDQVTDINKDDTIGFKFEESNSIGNLQNGFSVDNKNQSSSSSNNNKLDFLKIIIIISVAGGVLILLAITIAILWCCCRRCNNATITNPASEDKKSSHDVKDVIAEDPNYQIRENFVPTEAKRDTCDSVGFWTDDEDYDPNDDRQSKIPPHVYAMGNCIYRRQSSKSEIYMNSVIPPPPTSEKEKDMYINMSTKPVNKHFNVYL